LKRKLKGELKNSVEKLLADSVLTQTSPAIPFLANSKLLSLYLWARMAKVLLIPDFGGYTLRKDVNLNRKKSFNFLRSVELSI
jgi:hypothetical protein